MDYSKLNINTNTRAAKSSELEVKFDSNKIEFNLYSIVPDGAIIKNYNLSLLNPTQGNRLVTTGLSVNTNKHLDDIYPELRLKGNVFYEHQNKMHEIKLDNNIRAGEVTKVSLDVNNLTAPAFNSDEDVINYLIGEINVLKTRSEFFERELYLMKAQYEK